MDTKPVDRYIHILILETLLMGLLERGRVVVWSLYALYYWNVEHALLVGYQISHEARNK